MSPARREGRRCARAHGRHARTTGTHGRSVRRSRLQQPGPSTQRAKMRMGQRRGTTPQKTQKPPAGPHNQHRERKEQRRATQGTTTTPDERPLSPEPVEAAGGGSPETSPRDNCARVAQTSPKPVHRPASPKHQEDSSNRSTVGSGSSTRCAASTGLGGRTTGTCFTTHRMLSSSFNVSNRTRSSTFV